MVCVILSNRDRDNKQQYFLDNCKTTKVPDQNCKWEVSLRQKERYRDCLLPKYLVEVIEASNVRPAIVDKITLIFTVLWIFKNFRIFVQVSFHGC